VGIRSDVGLVLAADVVDQFFDAISPEHRGLFSTVPRATFQGALLYVLEDVKWYETYSDVSEILAILEGLPSEKCYLVEVCPEHPGTGMEVGSYYDNPFNLCKFVRCELSYEGGIE
tara:strand:+ start:374 stop:721 length:348 start_codon:yes stop_codon:yes gene_type:complete